MACRSSTCRYLRYLLPMFLMLGLLAAASCGSEEGSGEVTPQMSSLPEVEPPASATSLPDEAAGEDDNAAGGARQPTMIGPTPPLPMLRAMPSDLSTDVGSSPLRIVVDSGSDVSLPPSALVEEVAEQVRLLSWPAHVPIPITVEVHAGQEREINKDREKSDGPPQKSASRPRVLPKGAAPAEPPESMPEQGGVDTVRQPFVQVKPNEEIKQGWYIMVVERLPSGVRPGPWRAPDALNLGSYAARFHTGSRPLLTLVELHETGPESFRASLEFSEPLVDNTGKLASGVRVQQPRTGASCRRPDSARGDGPARHVSLACDGMDPAAPWRVTVGSDVRALSGRSVGIFGGPLDGSVVLDFSLEEMEALTTGHTWRLRPEMHP